MTQPDYQPQRVQRDGDLDLFVGSGGVEDLSCRVDCLRPLLEESLFVCAHARTRSL